MGACPHTMSRGVSSPRAPSRALLPSSARYDASTLAALPPRLMHGWSERLRSVLRRMHTGGVVPCSLRRDQSSRADVGGCAPASARRLALHTPYISSHGADCPHSLLNSPGAHRHSLFAVPSRWFGARTRNHAQRLPTHILAKWDRLTELTGASAHSSARLSLLLSSCVCGL